MEHSDRGGRGPVRSSIDGLSETARTAHTEIDAVAESIGVAMRHITETGTSSVTRRESAALESALRGLTAEMHHVLDGLGEEVTAVIDAEATELRMLLRADDVASPDESLDEPPPLPPLDDLEAPKGTTEWAAAVVRRYPQLTVDEVLAIYHYTTVEGVEEMNGHLRHPENTPEADRAAIQQRIDAATAGLRKLPKVEGVVFRGTRLPEHILPRWKEGAVVSDPAFTSSSTDAAVAERFRAGGNAFITITAASGVDVQQLSYFGHESEILFEPGTSFRVLSSAWDDERECWRFRIVEATT